MKNIIKRAASIMIAAATVLSVSMATTGQTGKGFMSGIIVSSDAANGISYVNAAGELKSRTSYSWLTSDTTKLTGGWYVVDGKVTIDGRLRVTDDSYIILTDGSRLTVSGGISVGDDVKFNIYTQQDGRATVYAGTTNGNNVTAEDGDCGIGGKNSKINIVGGNVYVRGGSGAAGIYGSSIHLYWTNTTDSVFASSYQGDVDVQKMFVNLSNGIVYKEGTLNPKSIKGLTLTPALTLSKNTTSLNNATYVATSSINMSDRVEIIGKSNILLANGSVVTASKGINVEEGDTFGIYGTGTLYAGTTNGSNVTANDGYAAIGAYNDVDAGRIIINGGVVYANGGRNEAGIGGSDSVIEINAGTVFANGGRYGAGIGSGYDEKGSEISILGGNVTANGGSRGAGIGSGYNSDDADITLGWTNETDSIYASSYLGNIVFDKKLYLDSTGAQAKSNNIGGQKIVPQKSTYTVTFESNGGTYCNPVGVKPGGYLSNLPIPTKNGYTFDGWYTDKNFNYPFKASNTPINSNLTLYAKWITKTHKITFVTNGGTTVNPMYVEDGAYMTTPETPYRSGYRFGGWYSDQSLYNPFDYKYTRIYKDITLYAQWIRNTTRYYTITFETNGAGYCAPQTVEEGKTIQIMPYVERQSYYFEGWYTDINFRNKFNSNSPIYSNMTLYAKWTRDAYTEYTVTFESNGAGYIAPKKVAAGKAIDIMPYVEREGYTFDGWFTDVNLRYSFNANSAIYSDLTLYAGWTKKAATTYTVTFESNGAGYVAPKTVTAGQTIDMMPYVTRDGYYFEGWFTDKVCTRRFNANDPINSNITLYALWTQNVATTHTVTFDTMGGSYMAPMTVNHGDVINKRGMDTPRYNGYEFVDWYTDRACTLVFNYNTPINSDIVLYAKWRPATATFRVTFDSTGGSAVRPVDVTSGERMPVPEIPTKSGFKFVGWYLTDSFKANDPVWIYDKSTDSLIEQSPYYYVTSDVTLYAKWEQKNIYAGTTVNPAGLIAAIAGGVAVVGGGAAAVIINRKKKKNSAETEETTDDNKSEE